MQGDLLGPGRWWSYPWLSATRRQHAPAPAVVYVCPDSDVRWQVLSRAALSRSRHAHHTNHNGFDWVRLGGDVAWTIKIRWDLERPVLLLRQQWRGSYQTLVIFTLKILYTIDKNLKNYLELFVHSLFVGNSFWYFAELKGFHCWDKSDFITPSHHVKFDDNFILLIPLAFSRWPTNIRGQVTECKHWLVMRFSARRRPLLAY